MQAIRKWWGGVVFLKNNVYIFFLTCIKFSGAIVWGATSLANISSAQDDFKINGSSSLTLGILYAGVGIATGLSPVIAERIGSNSHLYVHRIRLLCGYTLLVSGAGLLAWAPNVYLFFIANIIRTAGTGILWVFSSGVLQRLVVDEYRGRVFAVDFALFTLGEVLSYTGAGQMLDFGFEPRQVCMVAAAVGVGLWGMWVSVLLIVAPRMESKYVAMMESDQQTKHSLTSSTEDRGEHLRQEKK